MQLSSQLVLLLAAFMAVSPIRANSVASTTDTTDTPALEARSVGTLGFGKGVGAGLGGFFDGVGTGGIKGGKGYHGLKLKNKAYHHANAIHHNAHVAKVDAAHKINAAAAKSIAHHHHNYKIKEKVHKEHFHAGFGGVGGKGKLVHRDVGSGKLGGKGLGFTGGRFGYGRFRGKGVGLGRGGRLGFRVDHDRVVKVKKIKHHNNDDKARAAAKLNAANVVHAATAHQNVNHANLDAKHAHKYRAGGRGKF